MAFEPRPVPSEYFVDDIINDNWYCLDCPCMSGTRFTMSNHWITTHGDQGETPNDGVDIAQGTQVLLMRVRRMAWIEGQVEGFLSEMHDGFGPDDFVNEATIRDA